MTEVPRVKVIRLLLELVKDSLPEWMQSFEQEGTEAYDGSCRDYDAFFSHTRYTVPEGVLD